MDLRIIGGDNMNDEREIYPFLLHHISLGQSGGKSLDTAEDRLREISGLEFQEEWEVHITRVEGWDIYPNVRSKMVNVYQDGGLKSVSGIRLYPDGLEVVTDHVIAGGVNVSNIAKLILHNEPKRVVTFEYPSPEGKENYKVE